VFSVICCSNDEETLAEVLCASLKTQVPHQFLLWRNTEEENVPIPVVYNRLAQEAAEDWLLFVHQDVRLFGRALYRLAEKLEDLERNWGPVGVVGAAGTSMDGWLHDGCCEPSDHRGFHVAVQTLDECLFGCRAELLEEAGGFREAEELSWHGYATYLSYWVAERGYFNYAVQVPAWHVGPHHASSRQMSTLWSAQSWIARQACAPVAMLEKLRVAAGSRPMAVTSAHRPCDYQMQVNPSAPNSYHIDGLAADVTVAGVSTGRLARLADELAGDSGGVGRYVDQGFVHVDVRRERFRWGFE